MDSLGHHITRRQLLGRAPLALGSVALASLCRAEQGVPASLCHLAPRARRVLCTVGGRELDSTPGS